MRIIFFSEFAVSRSDFDSRCEPGGIADPVLEWPGNLIFVLRSKFSDRLKRLFVVQIPRVIVYPENVEHICLTGFRWRCDEVEIRWRCLKAQKSMKANLVIKSSKLYQDIADTFTRHYSKKFSDIHRN